MPNNLSRRSLIGSAGIAVMASAMPAAATVASSPGDIESHWQSRARAYREIEVDPLVLVDDKWACPYWDRIDAAETAILASTDNSPRAVEIRLWTAWSHTDRAMAVAITQGDVAALWPRYGDFDFHEKMLFAAILALRGEARA